MFSKIKNFVAVGVATLLPCMAYAEETTTQVVQIPQEFLDIDFTTMFEGLVSFLIPPVLACIGVFLGIWAIQALWRKVRSLGR